MIIETQLFVSLFSVHSDKASVISAANDACRLEVIFRTPFSK